MKKIVSICFSVFVFLAIFGACAISSSCSESSKNEKEVSILNWNLETFFDAQFDGNEYKEFKNSKSGWSKEKYCARLERLCEVIKAMDCDIVVMEELEKKEQLYDISNRLSGSFSRSDLYSYGCFSAAKNASIGSGIISRYPILNVSVHELSISSEDSSQPSMRPIIQADFLIDGKPLTVFVNHWKSKSGGEAESEVWRDYQEKQLSRLIRSSQKSDYAVIACGDFNRDISEFAFRQGEKLNISLKGEEETFVHSPWFNQTGELIEPGSYWFRDEWERIDNFFAAENATITYFAPQIGGAWADAEGHPQSYKLYNGSGYSDHLPIKCTVAF
ncbi:endonuclease/exonuclease/phosphatase family protein [Treponema zioleckii]|uniref:endonuclease/exonuclease/phosphatase family protein n=1 Tax=Treponema zioleckii TaxID=331680 RepID=UPI00168B0C1E|nr:endonuclease/exonuclease/phosphatase family protein [Treponema zioleckii]